MKTMHTAVEMADWCAKQKDLADVKTSFHIAIDPLTGIREATLYTDDGKGNGNFILRFSME